MKNFLLLPIVLFFTINLYAQQILEGFAYGKVTSPAGNEWQSPQELSLNKEQPRAWFFSFQNTESARKVLPEYSDYWKSLNGEWKFHFAKNPGERPENFYQENFSASDWENISVPSNWNVAGIQKDGSLKYGVPIYVNQKVIFEHKVAKDDWKKGIMRTPPTNWTTYEYRNEVGSYRRDFEIPQNWNGRDVFISFDGTDSFFYLWINGQYVGFSKNSRNAARFNITSYLQAGKNTVAVEVYRNSDGSFLEAQDMYRLPGIFRTVALYSVPKVHIRDINAIPELDADYINGALNITSYIRNLGNNAVKGYKVIYSLYANQLYADENALVQGASAVVPVQSLNSSDEVQTHTVLKITAPNKWSAEMPWRYTLVAELKDAKNKTIETVSAIVGFRKVEIKDTRAIDDEFGLAGRYYYINGKTVKLKGVNRHEMSPAYGHAVPREQMLEELMIMKRANINHVRNSHYPDDPYWYYLCNKYGIYLEDEANVESHEYYYGEASLSHPPEWRAAHVARGMEMVRSNINNPAIVIWSLGNEAGPGKNFVASYDAIKNFDTSRPVQYERNNDIVDMGSNQYPSISWMKGAATGKYNIKYPFHISEYAHAMGNAIGNLVDYWKAIESSNFIMGAAIWEWIDQSLWYYDKKTGDKFLTYGGDFGDMPNDGQFIFKGVIDATLRPKPHYYEVKKVYQNIAVDSIDAHNGSFEIFNKNYFTDLSDYDVRWALYEDGVEIKSGFTNADAAPRAKIKITVPYIYNQLKRSSEYFVKFQFLQKEDKPWAKKGYIQADEQYLIKQSDSAPSVASMQKGYESPVITDAGSFKNIKGKNFNIRFDMNTGSIYSLSYNNETIIDPGNGPKLDAFRAYVNNDNWAAGKWFENGLHNLKHKAIESNIFKRNDGAVVLSYRVESQAPNGATLLGGTDGTRNGIQEWVTKPFGTDDFKFITNQVWTVYPDGSIELQSSISSNKETLALARLGYVMKLPQQFGNFIYYGRGPADNYNDRKTSQFIELYNSTVKDEYFPIAKPQNVGNHEEVRWCALTNNSNNGAVFIATGSMAAQALHYSSLDMTLAPHSYQLPKPNGTYLHLDLAVNGQGGNSCGQGPPLAQDRVYASAQTFGFIIRPAGKNPALAAKVSAGGEYPLSITRNSAGAVTITSAKQNSEIVYQLNSDKKILNNVQPVYFKQGGTVTAWFKNNPAIRSTISFNKIEAVPLKVINASSVETGEGDAEHLIDGNAETYWHTMYSVTVAKHPHWVDFDMGAIKTVKGFTYLPRSGGGNGTVKNYTLHLSTDGKNWSEPVAKGTFEQGGAEKKVLLAKPQKARYARFTALSEQSGQDFASGAEFSILEQ